jgi:hypothetical protein
LFSGPLGPGDRKGDDWIVAKVGSGTMPLVALPSVRRARVMLLSPMHSWALEPSSAEAATGGMRHRGCV